MSDSNPHDVCRAMAGPKPRPRTSNGYDIEWLRSKLHEMCDRVIDLEKRLRWPINLGHSCKAESHFFGTTVEMGDNPVKMRLMFFWHDGKPAIQIQSAPALDVLLRAVLEDGEFKNLPRLSNNDVAPWKIVAAYPYQEES